MPKKTRKKDMSWKEVIDLTAKKIKDVLDELREYDRRP